MPSESSTTVREDFLREDFRTRFVSHSRRQVISLANRLGCRCRYDVRESVYRTHTTFGQCVRFRKRNSWRVRVCSADRKYLFSAHVIAATAILCARRARDGSNIIIITISLSDQSLRRCDRRRYAFAHVLIKSF